jgi:hypothetical protein
VTTDDLIAAHTTAWSDDERAALRTVVASLRPSARHLTDMLDWLDDIAARDGTRAGAVLAEPELTAALRSGSSAPERLKHWKERLRRLRYPRLAARERALDDAIRRLALGTAITLAPPADLEGGVLTVTIRARSSDELAAAVECLRERLARGDVERLFALLDEA